MRYYNGFAAPLSSSSTSCESKVESDDNSHLRIGVVGGGLGGITAANSIHNRLSSDPNRSFSIKVFESSNITNDWEAASNKNGNSIVPGASMSIMSQQSTLVSIITDWFILHFKHKISKDWEHPPPYFGFDLQKCLSSPEERQVFWAFMKNFIRISLHTRPEMAHDRAEINVQIAKANRHEFLKTVNNMTETERKKLNITQGFLALYRTEAAAKDTFLKVQVFNEPADLIPKEEALKLCPFVKNFPFEIWGAIHRTSDYTANCTQFVSWLKDQCVKKGVEVYDNYKVTKVSKTPNGFKIASENDEKEVDILILANGAYSFFFAQQLGAGKSCPVYPLRGFSLTLHHEGDKKDGIPLLPKPVSIDNMFISSTTPSSVRIVGFGEIVGHDKLAPSLAPKILKNYINAYYPGGEGSVKWCFRPMSPDDIPIIGKVDDVPGLYLHTGHGQLGWSMCLATAECLAQSMFDQDKDNYTLPDGTSLSRDIMSPDRFH